MRLSASEAPGTGIRGEPTQKQFPIFPRGLSSILSWATMAVALALPGHLQAKPTPADAPETAQEVKDPFGHLEPARAESLKALFAKYNYNPATRAEVDEMLTDPHTPWLLNQKSVQRYFGMMHDTDDYTLQPSYSAELKGAILWDEAAQLFNMSVEESLYSKGKDSPYVDATGNRDERKIAEEWTKLITGLLEKRVDSVATAMKDPDLHGLLETHYARVATEPMHAYDLVFAAALHEELKGKWHVGDAPESLQERAAYQNPFPSEYGNVLALALYANPALKGDLEAVQDVASFDPQEHVTIKTFLPLARAEITMNNPAVLDFIAWAHTEFSYAVRVSDFPVLVYAGKEVPERLGHAPTTADAERMRNFYKDYHLPRTAEVIAETMTMEEERTARTLLDTLGLTVIRPQDMNDLRQAAAFFNKYFKTDERAQTQALLVLKNTDHQYWNTQLKRNIITIGNIYESFPEDLKLLANLAKYGFNVKDIGVNSSAGSLAQTLGFFHTDTEIAQPLIPFLERAGFPQNSFDAFDMQLLFKSTPPATRAILFDPKTQREMRFLADNYGMPYDFSAFLSFATITSKDPDGIATHLVVLHQHDCQVFYADLMREADFWFPKDSLSLLTRVIAVADNFTIISGNESGMAWLKIWVQRGGSFESFRSIDDAHIDFLQDDRLSDLDAALQKFFQGEELNYPDNMRIYKPLLDKVAVLSSDEFGRFYKMLHETYGITVYPFAIDTVLAVYENPKSRSALEAPETQTAFAAMQRFGFEMDLNELEAQLAMIVEYAPLLPEIERLGTDYKIDVAAQIRAGQQTSVFGSLEGILRGEDPKEFNFWERMLALHRTGRLARLFEPQALAYYRSFGEKFKYKLSIHSLESWTQLLEDEEHIRVLDSADFQTFWKRLNSDVPPSIEMLSVAGNRLDISYPFSPELALLYGDLFAQQENFFTVATALRAEPYNYTEFSYADLRFFEDLLGNPVAQEKLFTPEVAETITRLGARSYTFALEDTWALLQITDHPELEAKLFDPSVDELVENIFHIKLEQKGKLFIGLRAQIVPFATDAAQKELLMSEGARETQRRIGEINLRQKIGPTNLNGLVLLTNHPEAVDFLETYKDHIDFYNGSVDLYDAAPSLVAFASNPQAQGLMQPFLEDRSYRFDPKDGFIWNTLAEYYKSPEALAVKVGHFEEVTGMRQWTARDFWFWVNDPSFVTDRATLQAALTPLFAADIHRRDSNFESYASYNDLDTFTIVELNRMRVIRDAFHEKQRLPRAAVRLMTQDVQKLPYTETGFMLELDRGRVHFEPYPSQPNYSNGAYSPNAEMLAAMPEGLAFGHCHATSWDSARVAGPSGGVYSYGGDIDAARSFGQDGVVLTALEEGRFAVHFYSTERNVAFLGVYSDPR